MADLTDAHVIVGAGQAAARAAKAMREAGFEGRIMLIGSEPHLPYERPPLSKALLLDPSLPPPLVLPAAAYDELGIEVLTGTTVEGIDRARKRVMLGDGSSVRYDKLLLATGSSLRTLSIPGLPDERVLSLRSIEDSRAIGAILGTGRPVALIGGGFVGLEVAALLSESGCRVTVVEMSDRLLPRLGSPDVSDMARRHHEALGTTILLGRTVRGYEQPNLVLDDDTLVPADYVVSGIGVTPNARLAEQAGLEVSDGIVVDEHGMTSDPDIFAAGDVTRQHHVPLGRQIRLESWHNANVQGEAAGRSMVGLPTHGKEVPWVWSDQGRLKIQIVGDASVADTTVLRGDPVDLDAGASVFQLAAGRLVGAVTVNRGKDMTLIRRFIGSANTEVDERLLADDAVPLKKALAARTDA